MGMHTILWWLLGSQARMRCIYILVDRGTEVWSATMSIEDWTCRAGIGQCLGALRFHSISFYTACVESQAGPPVLLVLNKTDLLPPAELAAALGQAADWGYEALPVCAGTGAGLADLAERLAGRVTVLAGPSGEAASCSAASAHSEAAGYM